MHVTVPPAAVHVGEPGTEDTNATPAPSTSVITKVLAVLAPPLIAVIEYVAVAGDNVADGAVLTRLMLAAPVSVAHGASNSALRNSRAPCELVTSAALVP